MFRGLARLAVVCAVALLVAGWLIFSFVTPKMQGWGDRIGDGLDRFTTTTVAD